MLFSFHKQVNQGTGACKRANTSTRIGLLSHILAVLDTSICNTCKDKLLSINSANAKVYSKSAYIKFNLYYIISQLKLSRDKKTDDLLT
jgi:hypothetical protein